MLVSSLMLKALINKLLLILYRHVQNIFEALCLHTTKMFIINDASVIVMLLLCFCAAWSGHKLNETPSAFIAFHFFLFSSSLRLFTLCCSHSAYLLFHLSTCWLFFSCTWLMTVWYLSRVPSVPWYALVVSLLLPGLFLLLLHPGSQPTLTYVSASDNS